jgi:hypothetical protein
MLDRQALTWGQSAAENVRLDATADLLAERAGHAIGLTSTQRYRSRRLFSPDPILVAEVNPRR